MSDNILELARRIVALNTSEKSQTVGVDVYKVCELAMDLAEAIIATAAGDDGEPVKTTNAPDSVVAWNGSHDQATTARRRS